MKINLASIGAAVPLAVAVAAPAGAVNLAPGSNLNIDGSVNVPNQSTFEFFDFVGDGSSETEDTAEPVGQYGEFTVGAGNTGNFQGLEGQVGDILSFDRGTDLSANPLLRVDDPEGVTQNFFATTPPTTQFEGNIGIVRVNGVFRNGNEIVADGTFTSQFARGSTGETTYSASFTTVPEPTTMAGSAIALGAGAFLKRKRAKKQKKEEETV